MSSNTEKPMRFYMPVAFFGGKEAERADDVWIKGERYREIVPDNSEVGWSGGYTVVTEQSAE